MKNVTLCYIRNNDKYLMLHRTKKKNDPNEGKWIGVGGHIEEGETPEECVLREVKEETGLNLTSVKLCGLIVFVSDTYETEYMFLFTADAFTGELIKDCNEGDLAWVEKENVMSLPMWEGDREFLPLIMEDDTEFFTMKLVYEGEKLCKVEKKF